MGRLKKQYEDKDLSEALATVRRKLVIFRESLDLSQNELARRSGISLSTINDIENGLASDIRLSTIVSLATALKKNPIELLIPSDLKLKDSDRKDLEAAYVILKRLTTKLT